MNTAKICMFINNLYINNAENAALIAHKKNLDGVVTQAADSFMAQARAAKVCIDGPNWVYQIDAQVFLNCMEPFFVTARRAITNFALDLSAFINDEDVDTQDCVEALKILLMTAVRDQLINSSATTALVKTSNETASNSVHNSPVDTPNKFEFN